MNIAVTGNHYDVDVGLLDLDLFEQADAVYLRHPDVEQNEVGPLAFDDVENLGAVRCIDHPVTLVVQDFAHRIAHAVLIVDH
jgi:hypothetical protein